MTSDEPAVEPVTVYDAAERLDRAPQTLHWWAIRYGARKLGKHGRRVYYDYGDLAVIERELYHDHPVPPTWTARARVRDRCPLKQAQPPAPVA